MSQEWSIDCRHHSTPEWRRTDERGNKMSDSRHGRRSKRQRGLGDEKERARASGSRDEKGREKRGVYH